MRGRGLPAHVDRAAGQRLGGDERRVRLVLVRVQEVVGEHAVEAVRSRRPGLHEPAAGVSGAALPERDEPALDQREGVVARRVARNALERAGDVARAALRDQPSSALPTATRTSVSPSRPAASAEIATCRRDVARRCTPMRSARARGRRCSPGRRGCADGPDRADEARRQVEAQRRVPGQRLAACLRRLGRGG